MTSSELAFAGIMGFRWLLGAFALLGWGLQFPFASTSPEIPSFVFWSLVIIHWGITAALIGLVTQRTSRVRPVFVTAVLIALPGFILRSLVQLAGYRYVFEGP
jgi:hypothetical protein